MGYREHRPFRSGSVVAVFACLALTLFAQQAAAQKLGRKPAALTPEKKDDPIVQLLTFTDKHHVTKIELRKFEWQPPAVKPTIAESASTTDSLTLRRVERALWHPLARAFQKHYHTEGNDHAYAELKLYFSDDTECFIGLHEAGFTLNNHHWNTDDLFYSWTLSRVVDELHFLKLGEHLTRDQIEGLSGEYVFRSEEEAFKNEQAQKQDELDKLPK